MEGAGPIVMESAEPITVKEMDAVLAWSCSGPRTSTLMVRLPVEAGATQVMGRLLVRLTEPVLCMRAVLSWQTVPEQELAMPTGEESEPPVAVTTTLLRAVGLAAWLRSLVMASLSWTVEPSSGRLGPEARVSRTVCSWTSSPIRIS